MTSRGISKQPRPGTVVDHLMLSACAAGSVWLVLVYLCGIPAGPAALGGAIAAYLTLTFLTSRRRTGSALPDPRNPAGRSRIRCLCGALTAVTLLVLGALVVLVCALLNQPAPGGRVATARNALVDEWRRGWAGAFDGEAVEVSSDSSELLLTGPKEVNHGA